MKFQHTNDFNTLASLKDQWNHLLQESASHVPFLTFEYQHIWWQTIGGGEWPAGSQLLIVTAHEEDQLVGIAPLFAAINRQGNPALMFVGAIEVSDFLDFIVRPADLAEFVSGLLDYLTTAEDLPQWACLDLYNILEESPTLKALQHEAARRGWQHEQTHLQPAPLIPIPGNYDQYLATLDKKQRHEIRRKWRNVENSLAQADFYFVDDPQQVTAETQAFVEMMSQDPSKQDFLTDAMRQHIKNTIQMAFDSGWLQLAFFTLDGKKAAGYLSFIFDNRVWCYNSGWEWAFREFSPGWVLLAHLLKWSNDNGISAFDFMRGDEDYKYKFGAIDRHIYRVTISPD